MGNFKVVFRADTSGDNGGNRITWEPGCPLMFEAVQVSRDTTSGHAYLQVRVRNIGDEIIQSFEANFDISLKNGDLERQKVHPLDADIAPSDYMDIAPIKLEHGDVRGVEPKIGLVETTSCRWQSTEAPALLPSRRMLNLDDEELEERVRRIREAGCLRPEEWALYATERHENWVLCSCGVPNVRVDGAPARCWSCHAPLSAEIGELEDPERLREFAAQRREAEEQARLDKEKADAERRTKLKKKAPFIVVAAVACLGFFSLFGFISEKVALESARDLLEPSLNRARSNEVVGYFELEKIEEDLDSFPLFGMEGSFWYDSEFDYDDWSETLTGANWRAPYSGDEVPRGFLDKFTKYMEQQCEVWEYPSYEDGRGYADGGIYYLWRDVDGFELVTLRVDGVNEMLVIEWFTNETDYGHEYGYGDDASQIGG